MNVGDLKKVIHKYKDIPKPKNNNNNKPPILQVFMGICSVGGNIQNKKVFYVQKKSEIANKNL